VAENVVLYLGLPLQLVDRERQVGVRRIGEAAFEDSKST